MLIDLSKLCVDPPMQVHINASRCLGRQWEHSILSAHYRCSIYPKFPQLHSSTGSHANNQKCCNSGSRQLICWSLGQIIPKSPHSSPNSLEHPDYHPVTTRSMICNLVAARITRSQHFDARGSTCIHVGTPKLGARPVQSAAASRQHASRYQGSRRCSSSGGALLKARRGFPSRGGIQDGGGRSCMTSRTHHHERTCRSYDDTNCRHKEDGCSSTHPALLH